MAEFFADTESYKQNEKGLYEPILDARYAVLCCLIEKNKKKKKVFYLNKEPNSAYNYLIKRIEAEGKRGKNCTLWFFNCDYDWAPFIKDNFYDERINYICFNPFIAEVKTKNGKCTIRDGTSFYPKMGLDKVGDIVGLNKMKTPQEVFSIQEIVPYCIRDCEVLEKGIDRIREFTASMNYKPKKLVTINKLGYTLLLRNAMEQHYTKNDKKIKYSSFWWYNGKIHHTFMPEMIGMASRGGRIEAYKWGGQVYKDVFKVDINSAYPYVCCNMPFPDILSEKLIIPYIKEDEEKRLKDAIYDKINRRYNSDNYSEQFRKEKFKEYFEMYLKIREPTTKDLDKLGVSEVTLKAPDTFVPYLPIREKKVTIYPKESTIRGFWTNFEISNAINKYGYKLIKIHRTITYRPLPFNMFKSYFDKLYSIKKDKSNKFSPIAKILANSSTGRFAMKNNRKVWKIVHRTEIMKYTMDEYELVSDLNNGYVSMCKEIETKKYSSSSNPVIFAHLTAYARDYLYQHMIKLPPKELLYVSTDAIVFQNKDNLKHFKLSEEMGDWKIEKENTEFECFCEHNYRMGNEVKASGTRKKDINLEAMRKGEVYTTKKMHTIKQAFNSGNRELIGSFSDKAMKLSRTPKRARPYSNHIEEITPSDLIKAFEGN